jgi:Tfp pilus assembly protein PilN
VSQVNLLPPDILRGQQQRRTAALIALGGALVLALILGFYLLQVGRLSSVNSDIEALEATNADISAEIAELQRFADLQAQAQQQEALLASAYRDEVSFSGMLMDLSRVTPSDSYVSSFNATISGSDAASEAGLIGTLQIAGEAIGYDTVATWLTRLEQVRGWVNPWVPSVAESDPTIDSQTFSASVDLTADVLTERGKGVVDAG